MNNITKYIIGILCIISYTDVLVAQPGQWVQKDSLQVSGRYGCVGFSSYGKGYIATGYDNNDYKRSLYSYTPALDSWNKLESLGGINGSGLGRNMAVAFEINGKAYVGTGQGSPSFYGDFWEYDVLSNQWQIIFGVGLSARRAAVAFTIDSIGYIGTGYDATGLKQDFWKFDPSTGAWTQVANYGGTARQKAVGLSMKQEGYVGLGDDGVLKSDFWRYNPGSNTWSPLASFPGGPRSGACGFVIENNMFVGTGQDFISYKQDFWQYNYWNNSWSQIQDFGNTSGTPRAFATGFSVNGIGYVGLGYDGDAKRDFYAYEPLVGIEENNSGLMASKIYPNPVNNSTTITINGDLDLSNIVINIYAVDGKMLNNKIVVENSSSKRGFTEINITNIGLKPGQYIYNVVNANKQMAIGKFLVLE